MPQATNAPTTRAGKPLEELRAFLDTLPMKEKAGPKAFAELERELHERLMEVERDIVATEMARRDVDAEAVVIALQGPSGR